MSLCWKFWYTWYFLSCPSFDGRSIVRWAKSRNIGPRAPSIRRRLLFYCWCVNPLTNPRVPGMAWAWRVMWLSHKCSNRATFMQTSCSLCAASLHRTLCLLPITKIYTYTRKMKMTPFKLKGMPASPTFHFPFPPPSSIYWFHGPCHLPHSFESPFFCYFCSSLTMYPDWPESTADLVPLPYCDGLKLNLSPSGAFTASSFSPTLWRGGKGFSRMSFHCNSLVLLLLI